MLDPKATARVGFGSMMRETAVDTSSRDPNIVHTYLLLDVLRFCSNVEHPEQTGINGIINS